jgi:predicted Rossmann-fold nucleotide-binding protein
MHLLMRAKSLVAFPGGFGTLDELFETLTLIQTGKITPIPVLLFGRDFWQRIVNFEALVEEGTISPKDLALFTYVETAEKAWEIISKAIEV